MNTYVVEGGIGKCTAFTALINKLTEKDKSPIQVYTPYIDCFAGNPNVKLVLEQSLPIQDQRIMASDNIYYCEPYKSNFQFGKQHIIESYCNLHGVEFDVNMKPKLYTSQHAEEVKSWKEKNNIDKYIRDGVQSKYILWYFKRNSDEDIWEHKQAPRIPNWKVEAKDKRETMSEKKKEKEEDKRVDEM